MCGCTRLLLLAGLPAGCPPPLAWAALLHDVGKPATFRVAPDRIRFDGHVETGVRIAEEICRRLRFPNHETEQILLLIANHMRFADVRKMKESTLKRFFRLPHLISIWRCIGSIALPATDRWSCMISPDSALRRCREEEVRPTSAVDR